MTTQLTNGVTCIAFKPDELSVFLIGTEEGEVHLCSTQYSSQYLATYRAHVTPLNNIMWNPFYNNLFITCASEYRVLVWHRYKYLKYLFFIRYSRQLSAPVLNYSVGGLVTDVSWAHHSSTVFAVLTYEGQIQVFDLAINKYFPICKQVKMRCDLSRLLLFFRGLMPQMMGF